MGYIITFIVGTIIGTIIGCFIMALMCVSSGKHLQNNNDQPLDNTKLM